MRKPNGTWLLGSRSVRLAPLAWASAIKICLRMNSRSDLLKLAISIALDLSGERNRATGSFPRPVNADVRSSWFVVR
ncbi:hypothetical protein D3C75_1322320 [compost metagenome]